MFGFAVVEKGAKPRPQPQPATLGMHLSNAFRALSCPDEQEEEGVKPEEKGVTTEERGAGAKPEEKRGVTNRVDRFNRRFATKRGGMFKQKCPPTFLQKVHVVNPSSADPRVLPKPWGLNPRSGARNATAYATTSTGTPNATANGSGCIEHPADEPTLGETHGWLPQTHDWLLLKLCDAMFPALSREVHREIQDVEKIMLMEETEDINELNTLRDTTTIKVAMDSGACRHVAHPKTMPAGVKITPNSYGKHISGAGGETIERFGDATTLGTMKDNAQVVNKWNLADVVRPLHSVAEIIGPADQPKGNYDVLFNNKRCVVVEAGVVEHIMQQLQAVSDYTREGNLYTAEMVLSPFGGPDPKA